MSESASPWGKKGPEAKTKAARRYAREEIDPELANDLKVLSVGYTAWREERDVADVWREVLAND